MLFLFMGMVFRVLCVYACLYCVVGLYPVVHFVFVIGDVLRWWPCLGTMH